MKTRYLKRRKSETDVIPADKDTVSWGKNILHSNTPANQAPRLIASTRRHIIAVLIIGLLGSIAYAYLPLYFAKSVTKAQIQNSSVEWYDELSELGVLTPQAFVQADNDGVLIYKYWTRADDFVNMARVNGQYRASLYDNLGRLVYTSKKYPFGDRSFADDKPQFDLTNPDQYFSTKITISKQPVSEIEDIETGLTVSSANADETRYVAQVIMPYSRDGIHHGYLVLNYDVHASFIWTQRYFSLGILLVASAFIVSALITGLAKYTSDRRIYRNQVVVHARDAEWRKIEERQTQQVQLLSEMSEWLQTAQSVGEFFQILEEFLIRLFPTRLGAVYLYDDERRHMLRYGSWQIENNKLAASIHAHECWSMRRGRFYEFGRSIVDFRCNHTATYETPHYVCVPINANGETIGMIHVASQADEQLTEVEMDDVLTSLLQVTEQFSVALANLTLKSKLLEQTVRDPLTNLYNRRGFYQQVEKYAMRPAPFKTRFIAMLDVDHFKQFNDQYGHDAGDLVLSNIGTLLRSMTRFESFRMGGEEFVIMIETDERTKAFEIIEDLRVAISKKALKANGQNLPQITASFGYAKWKDKSQNIDDILKEADLALYRAKEEGRNTTRYAGDDTDEEKKLTIIRQPEVDSSDLATKKVVKNGAAQNNNSELK